ncbi:hypothetical protein OIO90_005697 [Microbotryomycetes sp. JL221]|nr:hypothetical protein OIO90_005697 [Microbotryomycetes sp. JL221]
MWHQNLLTGRAVFDTPSSSHSHSAQTRGPLHAGAVFEGLQRSGRNSYKVRVNINTVDMQQGTVTGLLQIQHLTPELDSLVTFFEGEIIRSKQDFKTARWGATEADDMKHWSRFPAFTKSLRQNLSRPTFQFKHENKPYLFMRWKEQFVVPSEQAQNIHGASFAGFYYLCLDMDCAEPTSPGESNGPNFVSSCLTNRATSPPPVARARALSRSNHSDSQHRQQRPGAPLRAPSAPSQVGRGLPSPPQLMTHTDGSGGSAAGLSPSSIPNLARGRSYAGILNTNSNHPTASSTATSPPPPVVRPRRASSASFSYAAAVRGVNANGDATSPPPVSSHSSALSPSVSSATGGVVTPKEIDTEFANLNLADSATTPISIGPPSSSTTALVSNAMSTPDVHAAAGATQSRMGYFDHQIQTSSSSTTTLTTSSPPFLSTSPLSLASSSSTSGPRSPPSFLNGGWTGTNLGPSSSVARNHQHVGQSLNGILLNSTSSSSQMNDKCLSVTNSTTRSKQYNHFCFNNNEDSIMTNGFNSWSKVRLTGFYFFRHSEPYQELSLNYVTTTRRGGTDGFQFR